ncbi:hypothetical protein SAY87_019235 [Trapa incisa]|uniref:Arabinogalactan peptide 23-like n=1 Tax=Trapa incisa TaxID=236973 RepID=A0AAN7K462_9MYRT|nr:hypothetical protein SAY87_019235 [Trapa incisa]
MAAASISPIKIELASAQKATEQLFTSAPVSSIELPLVRMEMKKIACAVIFAAAASMSAVVAAEVPSAAPAPSPSSGAAAALPAVGSLIGASVVSLAAYYLH